MSDPSAPVRLPLAGGAWARRRAVLGVPGRALITGPTGRFLFVPDADLDAISRVAPSDPRFRKLADLDLLHTSTPAEPRAPDAFHHVVLVGGGDIAMTEAIARLVVDRIAASASRFVRVDLVNEGVDRRAAWPAVLAVVALARERCRAAGKQLALSLTARPDALRTDDLGKLLDAGVTLSIPFDGLPPDDVASAVRDLHTRYAVRGVDPSLAFVTGVLSTSRATLAVPPRDLVAACVDLGLSFVVLGPAKPGEQGAPSIEEQLDFQRRFWDAILAANLGGTTIVEMRLALHLEALSMAATARDAPPPTTGEILVHGLDGHGRAAEPAPPDPSCAACVYDPYCGRGLVRHHLPQASLDPRSWGTDACRASLGTFDEVLSRLASPEGPALRRIFHGWMALHRKIAERLAG